MVAGAAAAEIAVAVTVPSVEVEPVTVTCSPGLRAVTVDAAVRETVVAVPVSTRTTAPAAVVT